MAIPVKNAEQIRKMRRAGEIVAGAHELVKKYAKAGVTTDELDSLVSGFLKSKGAASNFLDYNGFPKSICTSLNEVVIHGIPSETRLKDGDLLSIDIGAVIDGYHGDAARTVLIGEASDDALNLVHVTEQSFFVGIEHAKSGNHLHDVSKAIQDYVERNGFSVVREYCGHGIGRAMHEAPQIPNYKNSSSGRGPRLQSGMTLAVEPMVNIGTFEIEMMPDGWTVVTKDGKLSAHYENTILVTDGKPEILTII